MNIWPTVLDICGWIFIGQSVLFGIAVILVGVDIKNGKWKDSDKEDDEL